MRTDDGATNRSRRHDLPPHDQAPTTDQLLKIYVEPTNECNLNCRTCIRNVWQESAGMMEWSTYEALLAGACEFASVQTLAFAGFGEPLKHPDFPRMVRLAHARGLRTELTTNALLLNLSLAGELLDAGLDQLVVSIDGASAEAFGDVRQGASLRQVVDNIRLFWKLFEPGQEPPLRIGIEFVAMKRNVHEMPDLNRVAMQIGASFILVSNVMPYAPELQGEVLYQLKATAFEGKGGPWTPMWVLPRMDFNAHTGGPLHSVLRTQPNISFLDMPLNGRNNYCPFVNQGSLAVGWDGAVSPCPPLTHSYSCYVMGRQKHIRRYEIGRLPGQSLRDIWGEPGYAAFRQRVRAFDFPPCVDCGCDLAERNEEDCYGNSFPVCGDCLWARGLIRCA